MPPASPSARPGAVVLLLAPLAAIGGLFPSFSLRANVYVLATGAVVCWLGRRRDEPEPEPQLSTAAAWWLVPALLLAAVELYSFTGGSTYNYPTLSLLLDAPLESYTPRVGLYFGWLVGFWALVRL